MTGIMMYGSQKKIDKAETWHIDNKSDWHGFKDTSTDYLYLDPIKVTIVLPGLRDSEIDKFGIPASIVSAFLEDHGIIVEKTGPYTLLFLFSIGITCAKSMRLLAVLNKFKQMYDQNLPIKEVLPSIYKSHPEFYSGKTIWQITKQLHQIMAKHNLPQAMYHAFDNLPEFAMSPYQAYQKLIKNKTRKICIDNLEGNISAVMVLPYPPGIPLIMPGEKITSGCRIILEFLLMLEDISNSLPGFEIDIHGLEVGEDKRLYIKVVDET